MSVNVNVTRAVLMAAVAVMLLTGDLWAEETELTPPEGETSGTTDGEKDVKLEAPRPRPQGSNRKTIEEKGPAPDLTRPSANAGTLADLVLVSLEDGKARVRLDGAERVLKAGDVVAGDIVRRIEAGRIVLARPEGEGREAVVLVTFDARKKAVVRVVSTLSPKNQR
jgi:hypothetical protein